MGLMGEMGVEMDKMAVSHFGLQRGNLALNR
jgi:hypothetical protein